VPSLLDGHAPWQGVVVAKLTKKAAAQLREHLAGQPQERLVELLMAEVERSPPLKDQLLLEVARAGGPLDLAQFRRSFSDALRSKSAAGGRRDYPRTSGPWAREVHGAIDRIRSLLAAGQAEAVIQLTEHALGRVDKAMGRLDDSSGYFALVVEDLERLHHEACVIVGPDPVALGRRLFAFEIEGDWDIFIDSVERYADVLGEDGIAEMRRLAEPRWAEMPERPPGSGFDATPGRFHLERMMEKLAVQAGDVDGRLAVMARDLAHPYDFLQIAEVLAEAGRHDDALEWAQRGLIAFADDPGRPDPRLDDFLLAAYLDTQRVDDAVALIWQRFEQRPDAATFARLRSWTTNAGRWDAVRPRALERLSADAERAASEAGSAQATAERRWGSAPPRPSPYLTLIEVLLDDGADDDAWALALEHGCSQPLWMALAEAREGDHPIDAVAIYQREVEQLVDRKQARTYQAAVDLAGHIVELLRAADRHADATAYVDDLRHRHKPKTKFLGMLTAAGL
jgi:hypothetical protein